MSYEEELG
jgi:hypothetical protein